MFAQDCSKEDLRAICKGLFVPECDDRINFRGAPAGMQLTPTTTTNKRRTTIAKATRLSGLMPKGKPSHWAREPKRNIIFP
jgi:hypothetical protein